MQQSAAFPLPVAGYDSRIHSIRFAGRKSHVKLTHPRAWRVSTCRSGLRDSSSPRSRGCGWAQGGGIENWESFFSASSKTSSPTTQAWRNGDGDALEGDEPLTLPVALLSVPLGLEAGTWVVSELVSSYMWFKVVLRHLLPLFLLEHSSKLLELSLDSSRGRLVLWQKKRRRRERIAYGSITTADAEERKIAGYLPVVSSASYVWYPPKYQLSLPAPAGWGSELDWYFTRFKSRMRAPEWWDDMGETYGVSLLVLVMAGYWVQGFRCFPWLGMNYYFKDGLQLDPVTLQFLQNTVNLPYLAKPIYGIISDAVYIHGAHRVPYIIIAGIFQVVSWGTIIAIPEARKSAGMLTAFLTFGNLGAAVADVANDALVAEAGKRNGCSGGRLQSFAWLASAAGGLLGNLLSGLALSGMDFQSMFTIFVLFLVCHLLVAFMVSEQSFGRKTPKQSAAGKIVVSGKAAPAPLGNLVKGASKSPRDFQVKAFRDNNRVLVKEESGKLTERQKQPKTIDIHKQVSTLFRLVKSPEILLPLLWFMGSYAIIPTLSGSIFYYQSQALKINPFYLGLARMMGQAGLLAGSMLYERYLKPVPLRRLVGGVQVLLSVCMLADIGLVNRMNLQLGIPDQFYILGASAFVEAIGQFKILPFMVLFAKLCPPGCEGSLLAFFMSCQCLACIVSGYLGVALASFLDITSTDFTHLGVGIVVQSMAALLPLLGIMLLPGALERDSEAQESAVEKVA